MKLVVIEDQPVIRALVAEILRSDGHEVEEFSSGQDGLGYLGANGLPDAVLLDWLLPDLEGEELLAKLIALPSVRCLIISGYPLDLQTLRQTWPGRVGFLAKPFSPQMLRDALHQLLSTTEPV